MLFRKIGFLVCGILPLAGFAQQLVKAADCKIVTTPGTKVVINGGITFTGTSNWKDSGEVFIARHTGAGRENWTDSTTTGVYDAASNGKVHFTSDSLQYFYGNTKFCNLRVAGDSGLCLNSNAEVRNHLSLDKGLLFTGATTKVFISNPAISSIQSANNFTSSWVHGRLQRTANIATPAQYLFPVGKLKNGDSLYAPVKLAKVNTSAAIYEAEYFPDQPADRTNVMTPPIDHISDVEYWTISSNIASGPDDDAKVYLSWRGYSRVSSHALVRDSLLVAQYVNVPPFRWEVPGGWVTGNASGADSLFGYVASSSTIGSFLAAERQFTLGTFSQYNALPVQLVYWTAVGDGDQVRLNWYVEQEQDADSYTIEHGTDGSHFTGIGTIGSLQRAAWLYTHHHNTPARGWNYYRLRITDRAAKVTYAPIRKVYFGADRPDIRVFPNPVTTVLHIRLPASYRGQARLVLYDGTGRTISSSIPASTNVDLNTTPLAAGAYLLRVVYGNQVSTYPFVKQ